MQLEKFCNSSPLTIEEKEWGYWNSSNNLAIISKLHQEYEIHYEFVKWEKEALAPNTVLPFSQQ